MNLSSFWKLPCALLVVSAVMAGVAGCGSGGSAYATPTAQARSALEAALRAWAEGRPAGSVEATPPVRVVDSAWRAGRRLDSFEVLSEEDGGDGTRLFTVRLVLVDAPARKGAGGPGRKSDQTVGYVVHGRDPVWVYSEADYRRMLDMDNNPSPARTSGRRGGRKT